MQPETTNSEASARIPAEGAAELSELGIESPLSKINTHLSHLWSDQSRTRASMINFAIYEEREGSLLENSKLLMEIVHNHACRGILIEAPPSKLEEPDIRAWVTAHCQLRGGKKAVCSEQLAFLIRPPRTSLITNTVFANLDSDLPFVLWWRGELSDRFEERFYSVVDRLLIDSGAWNDPLSQFDLLEKAALEPSSRFAVNDLAWSRSYHQRVALATLFEDPRFTKALDSIESITIGHKSRNRIPALMLAAWITTRLGSAELTTHERGSGKFRFITPTGKTISILFEDSGESGLTAIQSLELSGDNWQVNLTRQSDSQFIHSRADVAGCVSESFFPADVRSEAALASRILSRGGQNRLYFQMVPLLRRFLNADSD